MSRASFVLLVIIGVLCSTTIAWRRCPPNQEWTNCGSACPPNCTLPVLPPGQVCIELCVVGCQCISGYVLNSSGKCVLPSQCED